MPDLKEIALEDVLGRHLGQVGAPEELWRRVEHGSRPQSTRIRSSRPLSRRLAWTMAAAMLVGGAAWTLHPRAEAAIQSAHATEIREWVKARTDLDVPLRDSSSVQLLGAHVINRGAAAEIAYRAGDREAVLAVMKSPGSADTHSSVVNEPRAKSMTWTMGGQSYTAASDDADAAHAACLMCHS